MNKNNRSFFWVVMVILGLGSLLCAQAGRGKGRLGGFVFNETGTPLENVKVTIEFYRGGNAAGLKLEMLTNKKGEWGFVGIGTSSDGREIFMITATADGYLPEQTQSLVSQLSINPPVRITLREDKEKKARLQDESSMGILDQGNQLMKDRKFDEALTLFQQFLEKNPNIYLIYFNIGDCFREKGDVEKALEMYTKGQEAAKTKNDTEGQAKALASIGELYLRQDNFSQAQVYFKQSLELNPKDEVLAYNVAEIFFANNKIDDAIAYYKLSSQIKPEWAPPYLKIGYSYLNKADYASAIASFNNFLKYAPDSKDAPVVQGLIKELEKMKK